MGKSITHLSWCISSEVGMNSSSQRKFARILEIGPYPPPMAGWSIRIRFVKQKIESLGHECKVLNLGKNRKVPSEEYITVRNGFDYVLKTFWYAARGYTIHMHTNGDGVIGFALSLIAAMAGCLSGRRIVLSFHAGTEQQKFPRERSGKYFPILYLLFRLPKLVLCDNEAVKNKIREYGIDEAKIIPIQTFGLSYLNHDDVEIPVHVDQFLSNRDSVVLMYSVLRSGFYWEVILDALEEMKRIAPRIGLINAGSLDDCEPDVKEYVLSQLNSRGLTTDICFAGDLSHDQFLTLMRRSDVYLRTPTTDGECASVLESLTLGTPVVAAENGSRPESVVTFQANDHNALCEQVLKVISAPDSYRERLVRPQATDTIAEESELLIGAALRTPSRFEIDVAGSAPDTSSVIC